MQDISGGKIEAGCDLCRSGWFFKTLPDHQLMAKQAKLYAAEGVNAVVNAGVAGYKAALQPAVCGVHDRIDFQSRYITPPDNEPWIGGYRRELIRVSHTPPIYQFGKVFILYR